MQEPTVSRQTFLRLAPQYYAVGIVHYLMNVPGPASPGDIQMFYTLASSYEDPEVWPYFESDELFGKAATYLAANNLVEITTDPFGPLIIEKSQEFVDAWDTLVTFTERGTPVSNYERSSRSDRWIKDTLQSLERNRGMLGIKDADIVSEEMPWEPIPLDREEPELNSVREAVDNVIEHIRQDNGYNAEHPTERNYVFDGLTAFRKRLEEKAAISMPYIRAFAIEPMIQAAKTLGKSAGGVLIEVAKLKIKEWLMKFNIPNPFA